MRVVFKSRKAPPWYLVLVLLAIAGAGATWDLWRTAERAFAIHRAATEALAVEGDLEYWSRESRQALLAAMGSGASSDATSAVLLETRTAESKIAGGFDDLRALGGADEARDWERPAQLWAAYGRVRDQSIRLLAEGRNTEAWQLDAGAGAAAFQAYSRGLRQVRGRLRERAEVALSALRDSLLRAGLGLAGMLLSAIVFAGFLMRHGSGKAKAVRELRQANADMARNEILERDRREVLELVSRNEAITVVAGRLIRSAERLRPNSVCLLALVHKGRLSVMRCTGGPDEPAQEIGTGALEENDRTGGSVAAVALASTSAWSTIREMALAFGYRINWERQISSSAGSFLGMIAMLEGLSGTYTKREQDFLDNVARTAALAIERLQMHEQLAFQANHDSLTEIPNRLLFQDRLDQTIAQAQEKGSRLAVLWIDLDRFKQVNDLLGHRTGDAVLREVSRRLASIVGAKGTLARIGGDEFTILLPDMEGPPEVEAVAADVLRSLNEPLSVLNHELTVTASVGVSLYPEHGRDAATLVRSADLAMYQAKRKGRNTYAVFAMEMEARAVQWLNIERHLRTALQRKEFYIEYQAQVTPSGSLVAMEALLRWDNSELGLVPPSEFIPLAEETGIIEQVGTWVIEEVCKQVAAWKATGYRPVRVAVNVSQVQLKRHDFSEKVARILKETGCDGQLLELELTETAFMRDVEEAVAQISRIKELGVRVAIDDFGTGYSSLSYLRQLPIDSVKIDQSFIADLDVNPKEAAALVESIVSLAHSLGLRVVAEGVQSHTQLEALRIAGCDGIQGYLFSQPMPGVRAGMLLWREDFDCRLFLEALRADRDKTRQGLKERRPEVADNFEPQFREMLLGELKPKLGAEAAQRVVDIAWGDAPPDAHFEENRWSILESIDAVKRQFRQMHLRNDLEALSTALVRQDASAGAEIRGKQPN